MAGLADGTGAGTRGSRGSCRCSPYDPISIARTRDTRRAICCAAWPPRLPGEFVRSVPPQVANDGTATAGRILPVATLRQLEPVLMRDKPDGGRARISGEPCGGDQPWHAHRGVEPANTTASLQGIACRKSSASGTAVSAQHRISLGSSELVNASSDCNGWCDSS